MPEDAKSFFCVIPYGLTVQSATIAGWDHDFRSISVNFYSEIKKENMLFFAMSTSLDPSVMFSIPQYEAKLHRLINSQ